MEEDKSFFKPKPNKSAKTYTSPKSKNKLSYVEMHKVKRDGKWCIMVDRGKEKGVSEYGYEEFAAVNPGFKSKLTY
jgi:hypothetical protein